MTVFAKEQPELEKAVADPFAAAGAPPSRGDRWRRRLRDEGLAGCARHLLARTLLGARVGNPALEDGLLLMQLRAAQGFFAGLDRTEQRRAELEAVRTMPDREILTRFPRLIVPTYSGDEELFASDAFETLLPDGWPVERKSLDEVMQR